MTSALFFVAPSFTPIKGDTMRQSFVLLVALVLGLVAVEGKRASAASPIGSLALVAPLPVVGGTATFDWTCTGLPQNGGATVGCWVELICEDVQEVQPALVSTIGNLPVVFGLSSQPDTCEAHLFYDGWNNPRRRRTNTLATLFFSVP